MDRKKFTTFHSDIDREQFRFHFLINILVNKRIFSILKEVAIYVVTVIN